LRIEELEAPKADIDARLADVAAGRVKDFDAAACPLKNEIVDMLEALRGPQPT
jgi:hypothetical protein